MSSQTCDEECHLSGFIGANQRAATPTTKSPRRVVVIENKTTRHTDRSKILYFDLFLIAVKVL